MTVGSLWRISEFVDLSGEGGYLFSSRWHTIGSGIVFLEESPPGAILEMLVHLQLDPDDIPEYTLMEIGVEDGVEVKSLAVPDGKLWRESISLTRGLGDSWLRSRQTPLARVPSAILPHTWNYLLNPEHPEARRVQIASVTRDRYDERLFRFGAR